MYVCCTLVSVCVCVCVWVSVCWEGRDTSSESSLTRPHPRPLPKNYLHVLYWLSSHCANFPLQLYTMFQLPRSLYLPTARVLLPTDISFTSHSLSLSVYPQLTTCTHIHVYMHMYSTNPHLKGRKPLYRKLSLWGSQFTNMGEVCLLLGLALPQQDGCPLGFGIGSRR